jgi:GntR family transcriptional regulator
MTEPAYVSIGGEYARRIRSGQLPPGTQLPSYAEIALKYDVSDIVVRKAVDLLLRQGLVRSVRRRGIFVADRPNLVRVSPERQMEDPETTFNNESDRPVEVTRDAPKRVRVPEELAEGFGISSDDEVTLTVTRAREAGRPISISDTYQPVHITDTSGAVTLEELISDELPRQAHGEWLQTAPGDLVKAIRQTFFAPDNKAVMVSYVSYPRNRYDAFLFRMTLSADS